MAAKAASPRWRHFGRGVSRGMLSHSQNAVRSDTMRTGGGSLDIARLRSARPEVGCSGRRRVRHRREGIARWRADCRNREVWPLVRARLRSLRAAISRWSECVIAGCCSSGLVPNAARGSHSQLRAYGVECSSQERLRFPVDSSTLPVRGFTQCNCEQATHSTNWSASGSSATGGSWLDPRASWPVVGQR